MNDLIKMLFTFLLVTIGLVIFRAENIAQAWQYLIGIVNPVGFLSLTTDGLRALIPTLLCTIAMFAFEWIQRNKEYPLQLDTIIPSKFMRIALFWLIIIVTVLYSGEEQEFIYFQF